MKSRRASSSIRIFRRGLGTPGLILILLGQMVQLAQGRNLIVTQGPVASTSGGIAATTANPTGTVSSSVAGGLTPSQAAAQATQQVADMARAARMIITQQTVQSVAHAAAALATPATPVTDGLTTLGTPNPGLTPDSGLKINQQAVANPSLAAGTSTTYDVPASWTGVTGLSQTTAAASSGSGAAQTTVAVTQTQTAGSTAVLNWNTFNIGQNTTLQFNQADASSIAFNKVAPSIAPSQILGSIQAPGQVYVVNANGIIFGGSSQVNTHNLTASTLPINDTLVQQGLLNNPTLQFLFSALSDNASAAAQLPSSGIVGNVVVEPGAQLSAPTTADNVGGRIALIGPEVDNQGTISTPDGQTILAAGLQVGFIASSDPSVRGLNAYVGAVSSSITPATTTGTSEASTVIVSSPGGLTVGQTVTGTGIQAGATVTQISGTTVTLSLPNKGTVNNGVTFSDTAVSTAQGTGTVSNEGLISAPRGNITLTGSSIQQNSILSSTTSVAENGSIDLLAVYNDYAVTSIGTPYYEYDKSGPVNFAANSLTEILPEYDSTDTIAGQLTASSPVVAVPILQLSSQIVVQGQTIDLAASTSDLPTEILAPNATISLQAGTPDSQGVDTLDFADSVNDSLTLGSNAIIDVAGSANVSASVADNIISVQLEGAELANSPLQRTGVLKGQTIKIDLGQTGTNSDGTIWVGTPLADTLGYVNQVQYTVGELTTAGGTVTMNSGGAVNLASGSVIDVSGGYVNYTGAEVQTTRLITNSGQILDISQANPNLIYTGIYTGSFSTTDENLGLTNTFNNPQATGAYYEPGYVKGGNGGTITIQAPTMTFNGSLNGQTVIGPRQLSGSFMPTPSSLTITIAQLVDSSPIQIPGVNLVIQSDGSSVPVAPTGFTTLGTVTLSPDLINDDGFENLTLTDTEGSINLEPGADLSVSGAGTISLEASEISLDANIIDPSGNLTFTVHQVSAFNAVDNGIPLPPTLDPNKGLFSLGAGDTLSTAGLVVDNWLTSASAGTVPSLTAGGTITIASYSADLSGGTLDVSGGVTVNANGTESFSGSAAGKIDLEVGQEPTATYKSVLGGTLNLDNTVFLGLSGLTGGTLVIKAPAIQIGGTQPANATTLWLQPDFFSQGGFGTFSMKGIGILNQQSIPALLVATGTQLDPTVQSWQAGFDANGNPTLTPTLLPAGQRNPVNLSLTALGVTDSFSASTTALVRGDLVVQEDASLVTDPQGQVTLTGDTVSVFGSIEAPAGTISLAGVTDETSLQNGALNVPFTVDLGPDSMLATTGVVQPLYDKYGNLIGPVLAGGKITISGDIDGETGSTVDVSGVSGILQLPPSYSGAAYSTSIITQQANTVVPTSEESSGGTITISNGPIPLVMDSTLTGYAGGISAIGGVSTAQGGSLVISSKRQSSQPLPSDVDLVITPTETSTGIPSGISTFAASDFNDRGFDSLTLKGNVEFSGGTVSLDANASLTIASGGFLTVDSGSSANLQAPYVMLGQAFQPPPVQAPTADFTLSDGVTPYYLPPASGTGILHVTASDLIDLGNLSLQSVDSVSLTSTNDIRGDGTLDLSGEITLDAGQIYAPTATSFSVIAYDTSSSKGTVDIKWNKNVRALPYSAGANLTILASIIDQNGVLRAPFGTINLGWNGTGTSPVSTDPISGFSGTQLPITKTLTLGSESDTSVSAVDPTTGEALTLPYGVILNGVSWIDPQGVDITKTGPPAKAVNLSAVKITDTSGATVDVEGGGDLYAYQFVAGTGGSVDYLSPSVSGNFTQNSFAIIPGYQADYAPYAPYNTDSAVTGNFGTTVDSVNGPTSATDQGYVNSSLMVGDRVYLSGDGLAAGYYTLLPARYALLPGALLVTPQSGGPTVDDAVVQEPNGSNLISGYKYNDLNASEAVQNIFSAFTVESTALIRATALYDDSYANSFFTQAAIANSLVVPRLPDDSGQLVLDATKALTLQQGATVVSVPLDTTGLGGLVDIATSDNIFIYGNSQSGQVVSGDLNLSVDELDSFGAASLLIGGIRQTGTSGTSVTVTTANITVDNAGDPLFGPEIILVTAPPTTSKASDLTLDPGAEVEQKGTLTGSGGETLLIGNTATAGSGNGNVLWVTSNSSAQVERFGVTSQSPAPVLQLEANATVSAVSPILDSTGKTLIDSTVVIKGQNTTLGGSQITLWLSDTAPTTTGLFLTAQQLDNLSTGGNLTLSSQSSIDVYGSGTIGNLVSLGNLSLHAAEIRGFDDKSGTITGGDNVTFAAQNITLDNEAAGTPPALNAGITAKGTLEFDSQSLQLGSNNLEITQFGSVVLSASQDLMVEGMGNSSGGTFSTPANLTITTPLITTAAVAAPAGASTFDQTTASTTLVSTQTITSGGLLDLEAPSGGTLTTTSAGLGASLALSGSSLTDNTNIELPSGSISLEATAGNVQIGNKLSSRIDASGAEQTFNDLSEYTNGGQIVLQADQGNVSVSAGSTLTVAANVGGGNAGSLTVSAPNGQFTAAGAFAGSGGAVVNNVAGQNGSFTLDVASLIPDANNAPTLTALESNLDEFTKSFDVRVRSGNIEVSQTLKAQSVTLSADQGGITVDASGAIDASYATDPQYSSTPTTATGGSIDLAASGDVTIQGTLTVEGQAFNSAGKGGSITLESGTSRVIGGVVTPGSGQIDITGSATLNLTVDEATSASASSGDFAGTLLLIAPQVDASGNPIAANNPGNLNPVGVAVSHLDGTILGASSVVVAGNQLYQPADGTIDIEENAIQANGIAFVGAAGTTTAQYTTLFNAVFGNQSAAVQQVANLEPGAEIVNPTGSLTLGATSSDSTSDWNLATYRYGPHAAPGLLTIRAAGNLIFYNSISDGFDPNSSSVLRDQTLLTESATLPANNQSWSYRLVSGADVNAADFQQVLSSAALASLNPSYNATKTGPQGSFQLGKPSTGGSITTSQIDSTYYQVIRTGSGTIQIAAGGSLQLLNPFATIYTAGTQAPALNNFTVPTYDGNEVTDNSAVAQYSYAGGDVTLVAQDNIEHVTQTFLGQSSDSQFELPDNWLDRRGTSDSASATTTWWIDFSNFFEGIGALGGGNVSLVAGNNITNVDAVVPTNARMPIGGTSVQDLSELCGGNLLVQAANNIDGGVYYVERGQGTLLAGSTVTTNAKRLPSSQIGSALPVTLFLGQGSFTVTAGGSVNLGPVANPFLLPESTDDTANAAYFSTYDTSDAVNVTSLTGSVAVAQSTTNQNSFLVAWLSNVDLDPTQPWLNINEDSTTIGNYQLASTLMPATLRVTAYSGDIDLIGDLTLSPSPTGTIEFAADGSINALQPLEGSSDTIWISSAINLSDADPSAFPTVVTPLTSSDPTVNGLDSLLQDTGSTGGSEQFKLSLHTPGGLHANDPHPVRLYAQTGDISGLTLYSGKMARIIAGTDITDVAFYLQNNQASDISVVAAGRDILLYDPTSPLQSQAPIDSGQTTQPGDIQIGGPGTLEVLAGRNLTLGDGPDNGDGTGLGITSIGNQRNPYLASTGADIVSGAGVAVSDALTGNSLGDATVNFTDPVNHTGFIDQFLNPTYGGTDASTYLPEIASALGLSSTATDQDIWTAFESQPQTQQEILALNIFYQVLSDSGIDHNLATSPSFGTYTLGDKAIAALFPGNTWQGSIGVTSREIKTENGGSISLFAPGGSLSLGSDTTKPPADQGVLTDEGGNINIFTSSDVNLGASRIFTLRGGNVTVWSAVGNIAAGASSKTVQAAPPTRVVVDPQTGNVETDLAGLATGGGIGVLQSKATVVASNVNLIAPVGTIDAGDAGIRVSGNLNIAALHIVNASNISVGGTSSGVPTGASVNVGGLLGASNAAGSANAASQKLANSGPSSDISVQVIGYGGD